jgi:hypothetical protein
MTELPAVVAGLQVPEDGIGALPANIGMFGRVLRRAGLNVGSGRILDAIDAAAVVGFDSRRDFYWALHAVFVSRVQDHETFDQAFKVFWRNRQNQIPHALAGPAASGQPQDEQKPLSGRVASALHSLLPQAQPDSEDNVEEVRDASVTWSASETFAARDFASMSPAELRQAREAIALLRLRLPRVRQRRWKEHARGTRIDARKSLRRSSRSGGGLMPLVRAKPRVRLAPLIIICDISGSMSTYARMLLHFAHTLTNDGDRVYAFVFGTRLTHITHELRTRDVDLALARVGERVLDWDGGTRIGACLHHFNQHWSRRVLGAGAQVLFITDGLDRDAGEGLATEMARLHLACGRLICLNPLLRYDQYEPKTRGMRAILPHVDEFASIHNLNAMQELVEALNFGRGFTPGGLDAWQNML